MARPSPHPRVDVRDKPAAGRHRKVPSAAAGPPATSFRPDIQGLRAIAVSLVVVYHLYPSLVPGGYVGVDVFFVISGFLITGQLYRTMRRTGRVKFTDFYARRARRLLPAAALVLAVTWLASRIVLPVTQLAATAEQVRASALYVQNWVLANDAVSYLTADDPPTPVQHFWSLSVEEQFYVGWPLLLLLALGIGTLVARRSSSTVDAGPDTSERRMSATRNVMFAFAVVVGVASFLFSIHETRVDPADAYFVTTTRVWELAVGAALALLAERVSARIGRVGPLGWVGLALVAASAFVINDDSAFPGSIAALPVVGAALVILGGSARAELGPGRLLSLRPAVFVGDISYALYLWHWPLIILWQSRTNGKIGYLDGPAILVAAVALSWLTKVLVEDRVRLAGFFARHDGRSLAIVATAAVPVLLVSVFLANQPGPYKPKPDAGRPGAAALAPSAPSSARSSGSSSEPFVPPLVDADKDVGEYNNGPGGCQAEQTSHDLLSCTYGDTKSPTKTVALVGDSVAGEWFPALQAIAKQRHWKLVLNLHSLCPWTATMTVVDGGSDYTACHDWGAKLTTAMLAQKPDVVLTSARAYLGTKAHPDAGPQSWREIADGAVTYWNRLRSAGIPVVALAETPEMHKDVPQCLARTRNDVDECSQSRAKAAPDDTPMVTAARLSKSPLVAIDDLICGTTTCRPVVGDILVYRDKHHITQTYMLSLRPYVDRRLMATGVFS